MRGPSLETQHARNETDQPPCLCILVSLPIFLTVFAFGSRTWMYASTSCLCMAWEEPCQPSRNPCLRVAPLPQTQIITPVSLSCLYDKMFFEDPQLLYADRMRIKCFVDSLRRETIIELFLWNISNATFRLGIKTGFDQFIVIFA